MNDVQIRPADPDDAADLASVYHSAYAENRELGFPASAESVVPDTVSEWIRERHVYVAEVDDAVVGGVRLEESEPRRVKLSRLGVHEEWKGEGIGTALLDHAERTARERGYVTIWLTTPPEHPYLPDLYRNRGYEEVGEYPLEYRDYDEIMMEKRLQ